MSKRFTDRYEKRHKARVDRQAKEKREADLAFAQEMAEADRCAQIAYYVIADGRHGTFKNAEHKPYF